MWLLVTLFFSTEVSITTMPVPKRIFYIILSLKTEWKYIRESPDLLDLPLIHVGSPR